MYAMGVAPQGLSPRVRGNRLPVVSPLMGIRSIPARAGEPILCHPPASIRPVYPRACGGTRYVP